MKKGIMAAECLRAICSHTYIGDFETARESNERCQRNTVFFELIDSRLLKRGDTR